jgi:hypothetical protein
LIELELTQQGVKGFSNRREIDCCLDELVLLFFTSEMMKDLQCFKLPVTENTDGGEEETRVKILRLLDGLERKVFVTCQGP